MKRPHRIYRGTRTTRILVLLTLAVAAVVVLPAAPAAAQTASCSGRVTAGDPTAARGDCIVENSEFTISTRTGNLIAGFFDDPVLTENANCSVNSGGELVSCSGATTVAGVPIGNVTWTPAP